IEPPYAPGRRQNADAVSVPLLEKMPSVTEIHAVDAAGGSSDRAVGHDVACGPPGIRRISAASCRPMAGLFQLEPPMKKASLRSRRSLSLTPQSGDLPCSSAAAAMRKEDQRRSR